MNENNEERKVISISLTGLILYIAAIIGIVGCAMIYVALT